MVRAGLGITCPMAFELDPPLRFTMRIRRYAPASLAHQPKLALSKRPVARPAFVIAALFIASLIVPSSVAAVEAPCEDARNALIKDLATKSDGELAKDLQAVIKQCRSDTPDPDPTVPCAEKDASRRDCPAPDMPLEDWCKMSGAGLATWTVSIRQAGERIEHHVFDAGPAVIHDHEGTNQGDEGVFAGALGRIVVTGTSSVINFGALVGTGYGNSNANCAALLGLASGDLEGNFLVVEGLRIYVNVAVLGVGS